MLLGARILLSSMALALSSDNAGALERVATIGKLFAEKEFDYICQEQQLAKIIHSLIHDNSVKI